MPEYRIRETLLLKPGQTVQEALDEALADGRATLVAPSHTHPEFDVGYTTAADELNERIATLEWERDRAIETRENANAVSIRVEAENRQLREEIEWLREENGRWREELGLPR